MQHTHYLFFSLSAWYCATLRLTCHSFTVTWHLLSSINILVCVFVCLFVFLFVCLPVCVRVCVYVPLKSSSVVIIHLYTSGCKTCMCSGVYFYRIILLVTLSNWSDFKISMNLLLCESHKPANLILQMVFWWQETAHVAFFLFCFDLSSSLLFF